MTPSLGRSIAVVAGGALAAIAVDHATKAVAEHSLAYDTPTDGPLGINLRRVSNDRPLGSGSAALATGLTIGGVAVAAAWLGGGVLIKRPMLAQLGAGMIAGGMISNLADRTLHGKVTDMVPTPLGIVNVADLTMAGGAALFAAGMLIRR